MSGNNISHNMAIRSAIIGKQWKIIEKYYNEII